MPDPRDTELHDTIWPFFLVGKVEFYKQILVNNYNVDDFTTVV